MQGSNEYLWPHHVTFLFYKLSISVSIILGGFPPRWLETKMLLPDLGCCVGHLRSPPKNKLECPEFCLLVPTIIYLNPASCSLFISLGPYSVGCTPLCVLALFSVSHAKMFGNWVYHSLNLSPAPVRNRCFSAMAGLHCFKDLGGTAHFSHKFIFGILLLNFEGALSISWGNIWFSFFFSLLEFGWSSWIAFHQIFVSGYFWNCSILFP